jgi:aminopeptidase-like protein
MIEKDFFAFICASVNLNRTIVSKDSDLFVSKLLQFMPSGEVLRYPSGIHSSNWFIPNSWDPAVSTLKNLSTGIEILNSDIHPLFIAPYSKPCHLVFKKKELLNHVLTVPDRPEAFKYQHRLAYDPEKNLKEISISIPFSVIDLMDAESDYELVIKAETPPSSMKIFRASLKGTNPETVYLLSHYCHVGQLNDGLGGVYVMGRVFQEMRNRGHELKNSYVWLALPETIGSTVYLSESQDEIPAALFSLFSEMPGAESSIRVTNSRKSNTYIDRIFRFLLEESNLKFDNVDFRKGWGNDEMVFDSPTVGIPSISVDRAPFKHYHLSTDNEENFKIDKAEEIVSLIIKGLEIVEQDFIPKPNFIAPPQLSLLGLYEDWTTNRSGYDKVMNMLDETVGNLSVFDIARSYNIPLENAFEFFDELYANNLIEKIPISPNYSRLVM